MKFSDIPGHQQVKQRLRDMVDRDAIPHAILLEGPAGIGKFALARALAQYIHCESPVDGEPCGHCPSCLQHQSFNHLDTYYSYPVARREKMNTPPVSADFADEWHRFLADDMFMNFDRWAATFERKNLKPTFYVTESVELLRMLNFTTHGARYKIVLLWLPERMGEETANKLLKIIEEPFSDTIFIMTSNAPASILPTIYSRLRRIGVKRLSDDEIASWLVTTAAVNPDDALAIAHNAEGSPARAVALLDTNGDDAEFLDRFIRLMRLAYQRNIRELREWGAELAGWGSERQQRFYGYCQRLVRENFVYNFGTPRLNYMNRSEANFAVNFARFINERNCEKIIEVLNGALTDIAGNANAKIVNLDVAIKIILLLKR